MNKREEILTLANQAVNGERQRTYGSLISGPPISKWL